MSSKTSALEVVVIGSGLAGLSSACVLAARGHRVTLLEKNDWVGGKAAVLRSEGYRFDMGPHDPDDPKCAAKSLRGSRPQHR